MVEIRDAGPKDIDFILDCQVKMASETEEMDLDSDTLRNGIEELLRKPELGTYLVAESDGKPVGCTLTLREWSDWRNGWVIWIHSVYVIPEFRKMGVFAKIYEGEKNKVLNDPSVKGLRLYVEKENINAQKVYRRLGMSDERYQLFEWMPED